jgi:hypothetical protein
MATDLWAGSTGELVGLGLAGALVSAWSVPWAILLLGAGIGAAATLLWLADQRDHASAAPVDDALVAAVAASASN